MTEEINYSNDEIDHRKIWISNGFPYKVPGAKVAG
jgi:hypothetical protein